MLSRSVAFRSLHDIQHPVDTFACRMYLAPRGPVIIVEACPSNVTLDDMRIIWYHARHRLEKASEVLAVLLKYTVPCIISPQRSRVASLVCTLTCDTEALYLNVNERTMCMLNFDVQRANNSYSNSIIHCQQVFWLPSFAWLFDVCQAMCRCYLLP